jgi:hypothetical protein
MVCYDACVFHFNTKEGREGRKEGKEEEKTHTLKYQTVTGNDKTICVHLLNQI